MIVEEVTNGYIVTRYQDDVKHLTWVYNDPYQVADRVEEELTGKEVRSINLNLNNPNEKSEGSKESGTKMEIEIHQTEKVRPSVARPIPKRNVKSKHRKVAQTPVGKKSTGKNPYRKG